MIQGFKAFLLRGNVIDLAVAVVVGAAFGGVVSAFADDFVGGLIGVVGGSPDFGRAGFTVNGSKIVYGSTITALINFLIVAGVVYVAIVAPMTRLAGHRGAGPGADAGADTPAPSDEAVLLAEIRDLLRGERTG